jgi:hypothetical protein
MTELLYETPIPGIPIFPPEVNPKPTDHIIGYRVVYAPAGVFCKPEPSKITTCGWLNIGILIVLFWPISCIPCCITSSYSDYQVPVYGSKYHKTLKDL